MVASTGRTGETLASSARAIPFDYVTTFRLTGSPATVLEDEVSVNAEAGFVATAIGYGLEVEGRGVEITGQTDPFPLAGVRLRNLPTSALQDGIRIRPEFRRIVVEGGGGLSNSIPRGLAGAILERLNLADHVSFRYSIDPMDALRQE